MPAPARTPRFFKLSLTTTTPSLRVADCATIGSTNRSPLSLLPPDFVTELIAIPPYGYQAGSAVVA